MMLLTEQAIYRRAFYQFYIPISLYLEVYYSDCVMPFNVFYGAAESLPACEVIADWMWKLKK